MCSVVDILLPVRVLIILIIILIMILIIILILIICFAPTMHYYWKMHLAHVADPVSVGWQEANCKLLSKKTNLTVRRKPRNKMIHRRQHGSIPQFKETKTLKHTHTHMLTPQHTHTHMHTLTRTRPHIHTHTVKHISDKQHTDTQHIVEKLLQVARQQWQDITRSEHGPAGPCQCSESSTHVVFLLCFPDSKCNICLCSGSETTSRRSQASGW